MRETCRKAPQERALRRWQCQYQCNSDEDRHPIHVQGQLYVLKSVTILTTPIRMDSFSRRYDSTPNTNYCTVPAKVAEPTPAGPLQSIVMRHVPAIPMSLLAAYLPGMLVRSTSMLPNMGIPGIAMLAAT